VSEVCEQKSYSATFGLQRGQIREWNGIFQRDLGRWWLRLHPAFVRLPLRF
jgi:hypothetical protein